MKTYPMMCLIRAQANATRVEVYDDIGGDGPLGGLTAKDFSAQLAGVKGPLDVHINSYGGSVKDGLAITSAIRGYKGGPTRTIVDGMAASAASVILQGGSERIVEPGAMVMIHDASSGIYGNAAEMAKAVEELNKFSDNLAQVYAERAGGSKDQWRAAMQAETWYTADEAVAAGLADTVGSGAAALPSGLDLSAFEAMIPENIMARLETMPRQEARAAYKPQPYKRESWENVLCPVCGKYNDDDGKYCGQCGIELAGRDDVTSERQPGSGDDTMTDRAPTQPTAGTEYLRQQAAAQKAKAAEDAAEERELVVRVAGAIAGLTGNQLAAILDAASIDESDWDGPRAMSLAAKSDDPAATYKQICAGRRDGDPSKQDSWALPYRYPGKGPNASGVRNALSRLPQTQGLTNEAAAKALLERLMKQINPDHDSDASDAAPSWITQTNPAVPAWFNPA